MRKFKRAQAQNQASIEKHLEANPLDSSSDDENETSEDVLQQAVTKVLSSYQGEGGDAEKSLSYLTDIFQSGGAICLICISSVKKTDSIWSCSTCYSFMHLPCIQHWIRDSLSYKREKGITPLWACPKCRMEYQEDQIPKDYLCFCGQTTDPPHQPWMIPHSCGEKCDKLLQPTCGHRCVLLCHPGPCPPCPKMVRVSCYCGKQPAQPRRCNAKDWSCGKICSRNLPNCNHTCKEECHTDECPPCSEIISAPCHCGEKRENRLCSGSHWFCDKPCGNRLSCNIHVCEKVCHRAYDCGECPLAKNRTCPCGKKRVEVSCKQSQVPTCGDTCGKLLDCGSHYCDMRCHTGPCGQCLEVVTKSCRCRSFEKEIACAKEYYCNKKCTQMRLCGKHLCNKKCCDCLLRNNFNVCEKICDNTLNCQKHKCPAPCHSGPCYPCPRTNVIQCRCGNSKITVPCGRTKRIKPPKCNKLCKIPPVCHHPKRESHKCHHGPCPPCRKICALVHKKCGHSCPAVCHTKVWVKVNVNGVTKQTSSFFDQPKERMELKTLPCPPCEVSVMVTCLGGHETLPWPCHRAISNSCQRPCGQLLRCTNHTCELPCHKVASELNVGDGNEEDKKNCMECEQPCALPRPAGCTHPCPRLCHKAPCYPCKQLVKIPCHCGITSLYIRCAELTSANDQKRDELLKCGNRCPKNYECGHRCVENCHSGACPNPDACDKMVRVRCKCKRIREDHPCVKLRTESITVVCDRTCMTIKMEQDRNREIEAARKRQKEEAKNQLEVEKFERKFKPRRKAKSKSQLGDDSDQNNKSFSKKNLILAVLCVLIAVAAVCYANKKIIFFK